MKKPLEPGSTLRVELTASTMLRVILACAAVWLLVVIWPILLVIVVALMIAGALAPPAAWLERRGMRRGLCHRDGLRRGLPGVRRGRGAEPAEPRRPAVGSGGPIAARSVASRGHAPEESLDCPARRFGARRSVDAADDPRGAAARGVLGADRGDHRLRGGQRLSGPLPRRRSRPHAGLALRAHPPQLPRADVAGALEPRDDRRRLCPRTGGHLGLDVRVHARRAHGGPGSRTRSPSRSSPD